MRQPAHARRHVEGVQRGQVGGRADRQGLAAVRAHLEGGGAALQAIGEALGGEGHVLRQEAAQLDAPLLQQLEALTLKPSERIHGLHAIRVSHAVGETLKWRTVSDCEKIFCRLSPVPRIFRKGLDGRRGGLVESPCPTL